LLQQSLDLDDTRENDHTNFALRQIGQLAGQAIILTIRKAVFNSYLRPSA
jgi:hypothetical protein